MSRESLFQKIILLSVYFSIGFWIGFILFAFWQSDLSSWDMPGHFFASFYYKEYLWPNFQGWNHLAFGGYPQGYFYPPFFHWLVGGLAKIINLDIAFKFILSLSLILLPISIFLWLKSLGFQILERVLALIWIFIFLNIIKYDIGGDFYSTFTIGLITFQFSLPIYFFYLYFLKEGSLNFRKLLIAVFLFAINIISHAFVALAAFLSSLIYFFLFYFKKGLWLRYFIHLILAILLVSFWLIPFFYFSSFKTGIAVGKHIPLHPLFLLATIISLFLIIKKNDQLAKPILAFLIIFFFFFNSEQYFLQKFFPDTPVHLYRFLIFIYLLIAILISRLFVNLNFQKWGIIFSLFVFLFSIFFVYKEIFPFLKRAPTISLYGMEDFLGIVPSQSTKEDIFMGTKAPHILSHTLLLQKNRLLNGLFVESSANIKAIQSLFHEIYQNPFTWGVDFYQPNKELIREHLDYLGVCWIMSYSKLEEIEKQFKNQLRVIKGSLAFEIDGQEGVKEIFIYAFPDCSVAKTVSLPKPILEKDWEKNVNHWWSNSQLINQVLVQVKNQKEEKEILTSDFIFEPQAQIKLIEKKEPNYYKFKIDSKTEQFVYFKIPYFPNWRVYQNGKEIKTYRASPNFLLVRAKDTIEIKFIKSKIEVASLWLSLISWLSLMFYLLPKKLFTTPLLIISKTFWKTSRFKTLGVF